MFTHVAARTVRCPPKGVFSRGASDHSSPPDPPRVLPAGARVCRPGFPPGRTVHLDQGTHTNLVENQIRPLTLTRKNALFAGHDEGARSWACLASLIATCKLNAVEPHAWLKATLEAIANGHPMSAIDDLMPWAFRREP